MSDILTGSALVQATGTALLAFLWQGAAIGVVAIAAAVLSRRASPDTRYFLGCLALAALVVSPVITVARHLDDRSVPVRHENAAAIGSAERGATIASAEALRGIQHDASLLGDSQLSVVVLAWGVGVLVFGVHLLRGGILVRRLRRAAAPLAATNRLEVLHRLVGRLGLTTSVQLFESWSIEVPAVIGWLRPAIVVPMSALAGLSPSHFEAILAHELAHVRRRDYLVNIVQRVVETLLFYHPAVWWVSGWIRREREHCCDELAASVCGDRVGYARALRALEELRVHAPALAMGAGGGELLVRIRRLVDRTPVPSPGWPGGVAMIVPFVAFFIVGSFAGGHAVSALSLPVVATPGIRDDRSRRAAGGVACDRCGRVDVVHCKTSGSSGTTADRRGVRHGDGPVGRSDSGRHGVSEIADLVGRQDHRDERDRKLYVCRCHGRRLRP